MRNLLIGFYALAACAAISACAPAGDQAAAPPGKVEVKDSEFDRRVSYVGPELGEQDKSLLGFPMGTGQSFRLRSWRDKQSGELTHQLYVDISYDTSGWRMYNAADLEGGAAAKFTSIDRSVDNCQNGVCRFDEVFGIELPTSWLKAHTSDGFRVRIDSHSGFNTVLYVPADYLTSYLQQITQTTASRE